MSTRTTEPSLEDITRAVKPLLPPGFGAFLFGSRASGRARPGSDWDVGLLGPEPLRGALVERRLTMLDDRNRTSHTYNEATAEDLYSRLRAHLTALTGLHARLPEMAGR